MKKKYYLFYVLFSGALLVSCTNDDLDNKKMEDEAEGRKGKVAITVSGVSEVTDEEEEGRKGKVAKLTYNEVAAEAEGRKGKVAAAGH